MLKEAGAQVLMPSNPLPPLTGLKQVTDAKFKDIAPSIPQVTSGKYYIMMFNILTHPCEGQTCVCPCFVFCLEVCLT